MSLAKSTGINLPQLSPDKDKGEKPNRDPRATDCVVYMEQTARESVLGGYNFDMYKTRGQVHG